MVGFDPKTEKMESVKIPTPGSVVRNVSVDAKRNIIWLAESGVQRLGKLELGAHRSTERRNLRHATATSSPARDELLESRIPTQRRERRVDAQPVSREIVGALQQLLEDVDGPLLIPAQHVDAGLQLVEVRGTDAVVLVRRLDCGRTFSLLDRLRIPSQKREGQSAKQMPLRIRRTHLQLRIERRERDPGSNPRIRLIAAKMILLCADDPEGR